MSGIGNEPFYFGNADRPLFGCCHSAAPRPARACSVVLCYPAGPEYSRSHRTFRQLAVRLSRAGFAVLRFDYYGCGDSGGDFVDGRIEQWRNCIGLAVDEMKHRTGATRMCIVGLRLGASLAMLVGAARTDIDGMALWNPIVDGASHIRELRAWQSHTVGGAENSTPDEAYTEIVGYPFSASLLHDIERMNPLAIDRKPANRVLVLETGEASDSRRAHARLADMNVDLEYQRSPSPPMWSMEPYQAVIPHEALQSVVAWISKVYA